NRAILIEVNDSFLTVVRGHQFYILVDVPATSYDIPCVAVTTAIARDRQKDDFCALQGQASGYLGKEIVVADLQPDRPKVSLENGVGVAWRNSAGHLVSRKMRSAIFAEYLAFTVNQKRRIVHDSFFPLVDTGYHIHVILFCHVAQNLASRPGYGLRDLRKIL